MGRKKDFIDSIKYKIDNKITENKYADNYTKGFVNRYLVNENIFDFINNIFNNCEMSDIFKTYFNVCNSDLTIQKIDRIFSKFTQSLKLEGNNELANQLIDEYYTKETFETTESKASNLINILINHKDDKTIQKTFDNLTKDLKLEAYNGVNKMDQEKQIEFLDNQIDSLEKSGYDIETLVPDPKKYKNFLEYESTDVHPYQDKINELIKNNKDDMEFVKALNIANHATSKGIDELVGMQSKTAEKLAGEADTIKRDEIYDLLSRENPNIINEVSKTTRLVQINENTEKPEEVVKDVINGGIQIKDDDKEKIIAIIKKMNDYDIVPKGGVGAEQARKTYSLTKLVSLGSKILDELNKDEIDKTKIIELSKEYDDLEKKYDDLISDITKLGSEKEFPGNLSSSREKDVNEKYRNNIVNVSKLNALYISLGYFNSIGKDPLEFFMDPLKQQKEANKYLLSNETPMAKIFKENKDNRIEFLRSCQEPSFNPQLLKALNETYLGAHSADRAISGLVSLINDNENRRELEKQLMIYSSGVTTPIGGVINGMIIGGISNGGNLNRSVANYLIAPDDEFNVFTFSSDRTKVIDPETLEPFKPYDTKRALEKGGIKKPIQRLVELNGEDLYNEEQLKGINSTVVKDIEKSKVPMSSNDKHILSFIKKNKEVPENLKTNLEAEISYADIEKNGVTKENITKAITSLAQAKKEYQERSIFAKWFFKGVRNQGKIIDNTTSLLKSAGISENRIDDVVNAYINNDESLNKKLDELKNTVNEMSLNSKAVNGKISLDIKELDEDKNINISTIDKASEKDLEKEININIKEV